jgi:predicted metal-binding membrane protein
MWSVMMIGMMTPSAMPMIFMYARVGRHAEAQRAPLGTTFWFVAGYFLVWVAFALLSALAQWALERTALLDFAMASTSNVFGGLMSSCGQLPVDPPQGHLPYPVSDAVAVPDAAWRLSPRLAG